MTEQGDLFQNVQGVVVPRDICARKHGGNPESAAAFDVIKDHLNKSHKLVLYWLRESDNGYTVDELAELLHKTPNAISGRITELRIKGKIERRGTRLTRSGCSAAVWVVTME